MTEGTPATFRIFLVRHAHAGWPRPGERDFDRPLDSLGREEAARLAGILSVNGFEPALVLTSPAIRCAETCRIVAPRLPASTEIREAPALYSGSYEAYLDLLAQAAAEGKASAMVIGHNPMISETAHALLPRNSSAVSAILDAGFPTAGLLIADCARTATGLCGDGRLVGMLSPVDA